MCGNEPHAHPGLAFDASSWVPRYLHTLWRLTLDSDPLASTGACKPLCLLMAMAMARLAPRAGNLNCPRTCVQEFERREFPSKNDVHVNDDKPGPQAIIDSQRMSHEPAAPGLDHGNSSISHVEMAQGKLLPRVVTKPPTAGD